MNSEVYINGKKGKKLQKLYQDYQKVAEKVKHTGIGIKTAEAVLQAKMKAMVLQNSIVGEADEKAENPVETTEALVEEVPESWEDLI